MEDLRPGALLGIAGFVVMGAGLSMMTSSFQLVSGFSFCSVLVAAWAAGAWLLQAERGYAHPAQKEHGRLLRRRIIFESAEDVADRGWRKSHQALKRE